jgi:hypothetical protein
MIAAPACKSDFTAPCRNPVVADSLVFSTSHLANIPYTGHDTLLYVSDAGDSISLLTKTYNDAPFMVLTDQPGNPECPDNDYISFDITSTLLGNDVNTTQLYFGAGRTNDSCTYSVNTYGTIALPLAALSRKDSTFTDSIYLYNHMFYNVNRFVNTQGDSFYINGSLGLLQFRQNAKRFTIQKFNSR